jgi:hypothetical protein
MPIFGGKTSVAEKEGRRHKRPIRSNHTFVSSSTQPLLPSHLISSSIPEIEVTGKFGVMSTGTLLRSEEN